MLIIFRCRMSGDKPFDDLDRAARVNGDLRPRMARHELSDDILNESGRESGHDADAQGAAPQRSNVARKAQQVVHTLEQAIDLVEQHHGFLGRGKAPACSIEQRKAHSLLQALQKLGDRRLRDGHARRSAAHSAALDDGAKGLDLAQIHRHACWHDLKA